MKIGFDAKRLFFNSTGLGNYSRDLVSNINRYFPEEELYLFSSKIENTRYPEFLKDKYFKICPKNQLLWRYWRMVSDIKKNQLDIFHGLSNELPFGIQKANTKSVVTVHDLIFMKYPGFYPTIDRNIYQSKTKRALKTSNHIIAISESTKKDIIQYFSVDPQKVTVIYQSCNKAYYESEVHIDDSPDPYFLYVGSINKRKNLRIVLEALKEIKPDNRIPFYIIGNGGKYKQELNEFIIEHQLEKWVRIKNNVSNEELLGFYKNARFTIYPSLYEGFGIPILESQLLGTPVITSNVSSMPEVICEGSLLIDPSSRTDIRNAIELLSIPTRIREINIFQLRKKFNSESSARNMIKLYRTLS